LLLIVANVRTAVVLHPIVRQQSEHLFHRLRRCSNHRVRLHRVRDHPCGWGRQPAPGLAGRV
jgi:hypothetical protein